MIDGRVVMVAEAAINGLAFFSNSVPATEEVFANFASFANVLQTLLF